MSGQWALTKPQKKNKDRFSCINSLVAVHCAWYICPELLPMHCVLDFTFSFTGRNEELTTEHYRGDRQHAGCVVYHTAFSVLAN